MVQIFFTFRFLWIFCFCWITPFFILSYFYISAHCFLFSYLFCYIHYQNFARGSPLFSSFSCLRQNQNQHDISQGKHPAGARCFSSNGQTAATTQTNLDRQFSAGLAPDSMVDPWVKVSRLSGLPSPKQQTVLLGECKVHYIFFVNKCFLCPLLASLGNWKEGGARFPRESERLEERV